MTRPATPSPPSRAHRRRADRRRARSRRADDRRARGRRYGDHRADGRRGLTSLPAGLPRQVVSRYGKHAAFRGRVAPAADSPRSTTSCVRRAPRPRSPASTPTPRPMASTSAAPAAPTCSSRTPSSTRTAAGRASTSRPKATPSCCSKTARSARSGPRCGAPTATPTSATSSRAKATTSRPTSAGASTRSPCTWIRPTVTSARHDHPAPDRLALIRGGDLSAATAQTAGMVRTAAISGDLVGAQSLWMGRTTLPAGINSGNHHHGDSETGIYVVSGHPVFVFRDPATGEQTGSRPSPATTSGCRRTSGTARRTRRPTPRRSSSSPARPRKPSSSTSTPCSQAHLEAVDQHGRA